MSNQPPANSEPPNFKEPWRLRRVQRAQPHLGEGEHPWIPLWALFAGVIVVLVTVGTFLYVWLGSLIPTDSVRTLPLTATPSRTETGGHSNPLTATPASTLQPISTLTPTVSSVTPSGPVPTARPTAGVIRYRVKSGDTLTAIAAEYHVSVQAIMNANRLRNDTIYDGQELLIPLATPVP